MDIKRNTRKWTAVLVLFVCYVVIHEGAHLLFAVSYGVFKQINFLGIGWQIDIYRERLTDLQLGIFNLAGPVSTIVTGYILLALTSKFLLIKSDFIRAVTYFLTMGFLLVDPLYPVTSYFFGKGDMNGIRLLIPETVAWIIFGIILVINVFIIMKFVVPKYRQAYQKSTEIKS